MNTSEFQEEWLSAYLDNELDDQQRQIVEQRLAADPDARAMLEDLRRVRQLVSQLPRWSGPNLNFEIPAASLLDEDKALESKPTSMRHRPSMDHSESIAPELPAPELTLPESIAPESMDLPEPMEDHFEAVPRSLQDGDARQSLGFEDPLGEAVIARLAKRSRSRFPWTWLLASACLPLLLLLGYGYMNPSFVQNLAFNRSEKTSNAPQTSGSSTTTATTSDSEAAKENDSDFAYLDAMSQRLDEAAGSAPALAPAGIAPQTDVASADIASAGMPPPADIAAPASMGPPAMSAQSLAIAPPPPAAAPPTATPAAPAKGRDNIVPDGNEVAGANPEASAKSDVYNLALGGSPNRTADASKPMKSELEALNGRNQAARSLTEGIASADDFLLKTSHTPLEPDVKSQVIRSKAWTDDQVRMAVVNLNELLGSTQVQNLQSRFKVAAATDGSANSVSDPILLTTIPSDIQNPSNWFAQLSASYSLVKLADDFAGETMLGRGSESLSIAGGIALPTEKLPPPKNSKEPAKEKSSESEAKVKASRLVTTTLVLFVSRAEAEQLLQSMRQSPNLSGQTWTITSSTADGNLSESRDAKTLEQLGSSRDQVASGNDRVILILTQPPK